MCWDWSIYLIICSLCLVTSGMVWYAPCDRMNRMNDRVPLCQMSRRHSRRTRMNPLFSAEKMSIDRAWQRMNWMPNESWMIECWMNPLIYVPGLDVLSFVDQSICPVPSRPLREAFYYQHRPPIIHPLPLALDSFLFSVAPQWVSLTTLFTERPLRDSLGHRIGEQPHRCLASLRIAIHDFTARRGVVGDEAVWCECLLQFAQMFNLLNFV